MEDVFEEDKNNLKLKIQELHGKNLDVDLLFDKREPFYFLVIKLYLLLLFFKKVIFYE